ncbi:acyl-CoA N-acyltransferase [Dentipellis sp. KUC8613]|nr:acyl-CoA N-acyltransferase [Dentipellis sp. KUC8613]
MFETARLTLRAFRKADLDSMVSTFNIYDVQARSGTDYVVPRPESFKEQVEKEFIAKCTLFAIIEETDGRKYVGHVSLRGLNPKDRDVEVALSMEPGSWGKGYGTEVMKWLVDYGFRGLGMHRLSLVCYKTNEAALALYEKTGFAYEGTKKKAAWIEGQWVDVVAMGIVDDDFWAAQKKP